MRGRTHPTETVSKGEKELVRLLMENRRRLFGYIFARVPHAADAEDLLQETCVTICEKFDSFEPGTDFIAWASKIAYWKIRKAQLKFARSKVTFDDALLESFERTSPPDLPEGGDPQEEALEHCLGKLKPRDREMVEARYGDGGGVGAAAEVSRRSRLATYKALNRVRSALFDCINRQLATPRKEVPTA